MLLIDIARMGARKFGADVAVVAGDRRITYQELRDDSYRLASSLQSLTAPGSRVGILAENIPEYIVSYYGVTAAGSVLTFLNYRLHPREWVWILGNAEATMLLVQAKFWDQLAPLVADLPMLAHIYVIPDETGTRDDLAQWQDLLDRGELREPVLDGDDHETAWLIYTSGTTGFPKGAELSHRNLVTSVLSQLVDSDDLEPERVLMSMPLCHVAGFLVLQVHLRGGQLVLPPAFEAESWMSLVDQHRITRVGIAPTMINMILSHPNLDRYDLSSIRAIAYGAAAMPIELLRRTIDRFGPKLASGFAMTELSGAVTNLSKEDHLRAANGEHELLASCGIPNTMAEVMVVDENFRECAPFEVGEIVARGDQVLKGYFKNPDATREAFRDGWFRTGDMAMRNADGYFFIVDRKKDMILTGGENVYSREVEDVIYEIPTVSEAAVIGLPDEHWGERVVAVVVPRRGESVDEAAVAAAVRDRLAGYKVPRQVFVVDELPKGVTGKILKRELRASLGPTPDAP